MSVSAVVFNGTRLNSSDSNVNWSGWNVGGGAPASEPANAYQQDTPGSAVGAVGKLVKVTGTTRVGVGYDGSSVDYATNGYLWYCKIYITDSFNVKSDFGVEVNIGSVSESNYHNYCIAGLSATNDSFLQYPAQGGYIITAIDPTIDGWAVVADTGGANDQTAILWYAVGATFASAESKSENVAMDAIDYGTGLTVTGGGAGGGTTDAVATFVDFLTEDQDDKSNRWGVVTGLGTTVNARGILTLGTTVSADFEDTTSIVNFVDGYHGDGMTGIYASLSSADTIIQLDSLCLGAGRIYTGIADTRPDLIVGGELGTFTCAATLRNFRNVTFTSVCDIVDATIECQLLTQASSNISSSTIRTNSVTSIACLQDPTFGTTTDLHDVTFVQAGVGHAIEIDTATTYSMTNLTFTGYGADTTDSAALDVTAASGTVTINVNGGNTPTYKTAGATVVINNTVSVSVTVKDVDGVVVENARVLVEADTGGDLTVGTDIVTGLTDVNGENTNAGFNYTNDQPVKGWVRKSTLTPLYKQSIISGTIISTGFSTTILMISDE